MIMCKLQHISYRIVFLKQQTPKHQPHKNPKLTFLLALIITRLVCPKLRQFQAEVYPGEIFSVEELEGAG